MSLLYRLGYALGTLARPVVNLAFPPRPSSLDAHFATAPREWPAPSADVADWMGLPADTAAVVEAWRELDDDNLADRLNEWETLR